MSRIYSYGLVVILLAVALGVVASARALTRVEACGFGVVDWGGGEAASDPAVQARCPDEKVDRRREVMVEAAAATVLLAAGVVLIFLGRRHDDEDQTSLPPDALDSATGA